MRLAEQAVAAFWTHYAQCGQPLRPSVSLLTETALSDRPDLAAQGAPLLFGRIVEPLCDAFTDKASRTYDRVFAQVIDIARRHVCCRPLDEELNAMGLRSEACLLKNLLPPAAANPMTNRATPPSRIVVISRVTLGADVAINSVILNRLRRRFPDASISFVGPEATEAFTRSFPGVRHCSVTYCRSAKLSDRLNAWVSLRRTVEGDLAGAAPHEYLVVDPDSRLTQLGLLAPVSPEQYVRFPSRTYHLPGVTTLSGLAEAWLDETFGRDTRAGPRLELADQEATWTRALGQALRDGSSRPVVSVSFGVGGNEQKRIEGGFEPDLLLWLVRNGWRVLLARGVGRNEIERTRGICRELAERGVRVLHLPTGRSLDGPRGMDADVVTWEADAGALFAAIAYGDCFIGYDSAGQHIAAALGTPTLSIFVETAGRRHAERWRPSGPGPIHLVRVQEQNLPTQVLDRVAAGLDTLARAQRQVKRAPR